jgi:hypothetical protein
MTTDARVEALEAVMRPAGTCYISAKAFIAAFDVLIRTHDAAQAAAAEDTTERVSADIKRGARLTDHRISLDEVPPLAAQRAPEPRVTTYAAGPALDMEGIRELLQAASRGADSDCSDVFRTVSVDLTWLSFYNHRISLAIIELFATQKREIATPLTESALREILAALQPFAKFADALADDAPDNTALGLLCGGLVFGPGGCATVGDLRCARDTLRRVADLAASRVSGECERYRTALEEIVSAHLGDCPASMDEVDFARGHNSRIRRIARDALMERTDDAR